MWLSLVERYVRDVEVASSNLVISTKKEKTPTGCLFFFDYDYDFNLQYYARATKLYHRALCLERERVRWTMKRARQGNKQGVAQPIGRDTTMFMTERGRRSRKFESCHLDHKNKREATPLFCFYDEVLNFALVAKQLQVRIPRPKIAKLAWQA